MVLLVLRLQALAGSRCVSSTRRLADLDLLEAAGERAVALEVLLVVLEVVEPMQRSSPTASAGLRMFEASIEPPLRRAGADDGVDLVDEEDGAGLLA